MICGACKETDGVTREHVRSCYAAKYAPKAVEVATTPASFYQPMALQPQALVHGLPGVPASKYAVVIKDELRFYKVTAGTRNPSVRFVTQLIGAPGDWRKIKLSYPQAQAVLALIREASYLDETDGVATALTGPQAAAVRYSREYTRCACCDSPLSDPVSRAQGLGPVCIARFAA